MFESYFLGIMGITKSLETEELLKTGYFSENRKLMAGVLVNEEIFDGIPPSLKSRFPTNLEQIPEIFCHDERVINVVKFYWSNKNIHDKLFQLLKVTGKDTVNAVILPSWPPLKELVKFKSEYPDTKIFLSI